MIAGRRARTIAHLPRHYNCRCAPLPLSDPEAWSRLMAAMGRSSLDLAAELARRRILDAERTTTLAGDGATRVGRVEQPSLFGDDHG